MSVSSIDLTDAQSKAVQKAPRISADYIRSQIVRSIFWTGDDVDAQVLDGAGHDPAKTGVYREVQQDFGHHTFCLLELKSGFTALGHAAPASADNFNAALGRQFAYEDGFRKLWPIFAAMLLQDHLPGSAGAVLLDPLNQAPA